MRARSQRTVHLLYEVPAAFITLCAMAPVDEFSQDLQKWGDSPRNSLGKRRANQAPTPQPFARHSNS
ncbi:hypothetical protein CA54_59940 [Symmachiella macrocystis]|uniref:Uncharacterized protein n=1 Tax=Symmachiella macrocystis TaxID=2527985 RepID=A0A5C6B246_9PLAN|nr:hypothetical protein CA54_59940 [Symmachiella macrocystis]